MTTAPPFSSPMKLWLIERPESTVSWDEYAGHVVRAPNEQAARELAAEISVDEGQPVWFEPATTCIEIAADGEAGRVLSSFNAG